MSFLHRTGRYFWTLLTNLYFWVGLVLLVVLAFGTYFLLDDVVMPQYTRYGVSVEVPAVAGIPAAEARTRLEDQGLRPETLEETFNPAVPRGAVIEQNPEGGRSVKPGRRVYLTVNSGEQPMVSLPDVVDASLREAQNRLRSLGLTVGEVQEDAVPSPYAGTVTRQEPAAGDSLPRGTPVSLWYSTGLSETRATVPDVTGMTVEQARQALLGQKLRSVVVRQSGEDSGTQPSPPDADAQEDVSTLEVMRQGNAPDSEVRQGTEVRLYVEE